MIRTLGFVCATVLLLSVVGWILFGWWVLGRAENVQPGDQELRFNWVDQERPGRPWTAHEICSRQADGTYQRGERYQALTCAAYRCVLEQLDREDAARTAGVRLVTYCWTHDPCAATWQANEVPCANS